MKLTRLYIQILAVSNRPLAVVLSLTEDDAFAADQFMM